MAAKDGSVGAGTAFYEALFDNLLDGLAYCQMVYDTKKQPVDYIYRRVNKNFERLTGLKNVIGKRVTEVMPDIRSSNPELFTIYGRVASTGKAEKFETYVEPLARWFGISVYSPEKNFFVALFQNITDRKRIEHDLNDAKLAAQNVYEDLQAEKEALGQAKAKDEAMLANIGDGLVVTDEDGKIVLVNKVFEETLGWKAAEVQGRSVFQVLPMVDEDGHPVPQSERPISKRLKKQSMLVHYLRKDGTVLPVTLSVSPIMMGKTCVGTVEVFRDVTKEQVIDQAKTEFVSLASHQMRSPLSTINWYLEMLLSGDAGKLSTKQKNYVGEVYRGSQRMVELIEDLLNVSRIDLGTFAVQPEPTDMAQLVQSVIDDYCQAIKQSKLRLEVSLAKDIPLVAADPRLFRIVVDNVLGNAVKYTKKGEIGVSLVLDKKTMVLLRVSDTGYGIPKRQQDKVFAKFFRGDNVREKDTEGTGLGLYLTKAIIDHSGGEIWLESEEDKGTTVSVSLPLSGMKKRAGEKRLSLPKR